MKGLKKGLRNTFVESTNLNYIWGHRAGFWKGMSVGILIGAIIIGVFG